MARARKAQVYVSAKVIIMVILLMVFIFVGVYLITRLSGFSLF